MAGQCFIAVEDYFLKDVTGNKNPVSIILCRYHFKLALGNIGQFPFLQLPLALIFDDINASLAAIFWNRYPQYL